MMTPSFEVLYGRTVTVVACVVFGLQFLFMLRLCVRCVWWQNLSPATSARHGQASSISALSNKEYLVNRKARELANQRHLEDSRLFIRLTSRVVLGVGLLLLLTRFKFGIWRSAYKGQKPADDTLVLCLLIVSFTTMIWQAPSLLTSRSMACVHVLLMARLSWQASLAENAFTLLFRSHGFMPQRILFVMMFRSAQVSVLISVSFSLFTCWIYVSLSHGMSVVDAALPAGHLQYFIVQELGACGVIIALVHGIDSRTFAEARASMLVKLSHDMERTLSSILLALCDAVIRLSPDFMVIEGSAQLNALLLRGGQRPAENGNFMRLLDESDCKRFVEHVQSSNEASSNDLATSLHLHLRDASGTRVPFQIFNARLVDLDGNCSHILGVQELQREEQLPPTDPDHFNPMTMTRGAVDDDTRNADEPNDAEVGSASCGVLGAPHIPVKGTPAHTVKEPFVGLDSSSAVASSASSRSSRERKRHHLHPLLMATTPEGKAKSLIPLFYQWNFETKRIACCTWHTFVRDLRDLTKGLSNSKFCCDPQLEDDIVQCKKCGLLGHPEEAFESCVCGSGFYEKTRHDLDKRQYQL